MPDPRHLLSVVGKSLFALVVFGIVVGGYAYGSWQWRLRTPLPGGTPRSGRCAIWFVGSSTIHKWRNMREVMAPWDARNRGINGATLAEVRARYRADDADVGTPAAVVFYIGENDIADGATGRDTAEGVAALIRVQHARMPTTPVYVVGMKPSPTRWRFRPEQQRFDHAIRAEIATMRNTRYLAAGDTLLVRGRPGGFYQQDGIHLNDEGYRRWGSFIRDQVEASPALRAAPACDARAGRSA
jgi:lysophospholipase L1-like esterase